MDGPCHQLLTGAALSGDQDVGIYVLYPVNQHIDSLHGGAFADDGVKTALALQLVGEVVDLLVQLADIARLLHDDLQLFDVDGLGEIGERTLLHGVDRGVDGAEGGHHNDFGVGVDALDTLQHLKAVFLPQTQIQQHDVGTLCLHVGQRGKRAGKGLDPIEILQCKLQGYADGRLVVDDIYRAVHSCMSSLNSIEISVYTSS